MSETDPGPGPSRYDDQQHVAALAGGLTFILLGAALLLQELGLLVVGWGLLLPLLLVLVGLSTVASGLAVILRRHR